MRRFLVLALIVASAQSSVSRAARMGPTANEVASRKPRWLLSGLLDLSRTQPRRFLRLAEMLMAPERIRISSVDAGHAFEWQHRLAVVSALSQLFEPSPSQRQALGTDAPKILARAQLLLERSMRDDPSLLVRDGAVESVRRVLRMRPTDGARWKKSLELAFMDSKNHIDGEGLFIRETILTALREGSMHPSKRIVKAAERDMNPQVRGLLREWNTAAYDEL